MKMYIGQKWNIWSDDTHDVIFKELLCLPLEAFAERTFCSLSPFFSNQTGEIPIIQITNFFLKIDQYIDDAE